MPMIHRFPRACFPQRWIASFPCHHCFIEVPHSRGECLGVEILVLRQLTALFVAGAIVFGNVGASASTTASPPAASAPASTATKNEPPLKPGGPASIRQAQGIEDVDVWIISGLILGAIIWVLVDNDDSDSTNDTNAD
jgi:hypothetical protein